MSLFLCRFHCLLCLPHFNQLSLLRHVQSLGVLVLDTSGTPTPPRYSCSVRASDSSLRSYIVLYPRVQVRYVAGAGVVVLGQPLVLPYPVVEYGRGESLLLLPRRPERTSREFFRSLFRGCTCEQDRSRDLENR